MLTQCLQCSTVYRVLAAQLATANGFVTCGECATVFNALQRLADEPPSEAARGASPAACTDGAMALAGSVHAASPAIASDAALMPAAPEAVPAPSAETEIDLDEVPEILRADIARLRRRRRFRFASWWTLLAGGALLVLLVQVSWQYRLWWSAHYPALVPHAERLCARVGCRLAPPLAIRGIELVARDVRDHPQYAHALLVNATLANRSASAAAYPIIQLGVYDRNGDVIGIRRFAPPEYLDASIDIARGLPVGRAVYVVLEIAGTGDVADSFEFTFL